MSKKSKRELERELESLRGGRPSDFEVTTELVEIMEREKAEADGREILDEVGDTTRAVTWYVDGDPVGGSPNVRAPSSVDLVKVAPEG
jgi:hypothetical protein